MPTPVGPRPLEAPRRRLAEVAARLGGDLAGGSDDIVVTGVTLDSRAVQPGDLYAALPGGRTHGARFAAQAAAAGATAVLTDPAGAQDAEAAGLPVLVVDEPRGVLGALSAWLYGDPGTAMALVGVTGTNGKTTTAYLLEGGLRRAGRRTGLIGTIETKVDDDVLASVRTTPEAPDLQALLAVMRERDVDAVVMEVSSHALAQGRVDGVTYDVAAFTNLSQDHLDFHPTLEDYYAAKASLFTPERARRAVVAVDDAYGQRLAREVTIPVTTVSVTGRDADWQARDVSYGRSGSVWFTATGPAGEMQMGLSIAGDFNVSNALVAAAVLHELGIPREHTFKGLGGVTVPGRMQQVRWGQAFQAAVDYAHTPDAVERVITAMRPGARGRIIVVLGCGGDRDRGKRPIMGEVAARHADVLVVTDDNPRSEDPAAIRRAMLDGVERVPPGERAEVHEVADRREAVFLAARLATDDDTVLVLGKGHETGQEVAGTVHPFRDVDVLHQAIWHVVDGKSVDGEGGELVEP